MHDLIRIDYDRDTAWSISFVCYIFIIDVAKIAGSFLYTSVDRIIRHICCFCLLNYLCELKVICRIRSAVFNCYSDLTTKDSKYFSLCCIVPFLFMFDVRKF